MHAALDQPNAACPASAGAAIMWNLNAIAECRIEQALAATG
jgi:hypothetical protein